MAEVLGAVASGMTVASLFKVCIGAFNFIQIVRHQDIDLQKLTLRFSIERCRLYVWGETMGLTAPPLEASNFQDLACSTLQAILDTIRDTQKMRQQYGCRAIPAVNDRRRSLPQPGSIDPVKNLAATFSNFNIAESTRGRVKSLKLQTRWAIHDRKKFSELITEAKT